MVHPKSRWSSSEDESGEEIEVIHLDNIEKGVNKPFVLRGTFIRRPFHAHIDTGLPATLFTKAHFQKMFGKDYQLRPLEKNEKYIHFSSNKINFLSASRIRSEEVRQCSSADSQKWVQNAARKGLTEMFGDQAKDGRW